MDLVLTRSTPIVHMSQSVTPTKQMHSVATLTKCPFTTCQRTWNHYNDAILKEPKCIHRSKDPEPYFKSLKYKMHLSMRNKLTVYLLQHTHTQTYTNTHKHTQTHTNIHTYAPYHVVCWSNLSLRQRCWTHSGHLAS